jgi:hypothetical protein
MRIPQQAGFHQPSSGFAEAVAHRIGGRFHPMVGAGKHFRSPERS